MRLHRLSVSAFGPFAGRVDVDLDALASAGIFLIHGPTGSGKTSLLDAICFALYADVPGVRPAGRALRSDHAPGDAVPKVSLEFTAGTRRLRIERSPEHRRAKRRGTGETTVPASVLLSEWTGGAWLAVSTRADEAGEVVRDVLGLGLSQFVKVVLLPQGDFAAFLRATPESRREVLERLFDVARFRDIEEWLAEHRRQATDELAEARSALAADQARVGDVLARLPEAVVGELPGWDAMSAGELEAVLAGVAERVQEYAATALAERDGAEVEERHCVEAHAEAARVLECRAKGIRARSALADLDARADAIEATTRQLQAGRRAASVAGDLRAAAAATARAAGARREADDATAALARLGIDDVGTDREARALAEAAGALDDDVAAAERLRLEVESAAGRAERQAAAASDASRVRSVVHDEIAGLSVTLADLRSRSEPLAKAAPELVRAQVRVERLQTALRRRAESDACEARLSQAREHERSTAAAVLAAREEWLARRAAHLDGIAGRLAAGLVDGSPCPVCGSCQHPHPADPGQAVADEEVAAAEIVVAARQAALQQARATASELAGQAGTLRADLGEDGRDVAALSADLTAAEACCGAAEARVREAEDLAGEIDELAMRLAAAREQREAVDRVAQQAAGRLDELRTALERGRRDLEESTSRHTVACPCVAGAGDDSGGAARHHAVVEALEMLCASLQAVTEAERQARATVDQVRIRLAECGFGSEGEARAALVPEESLSEWERSLTRADRDRVQAETVLADPEVARALAEAAPDVAALAHRAQEARRVRQEAERAHAVAEGCDRELASLRERLREVMRVVAGRLERQEHIARLADTAAGLGPDNTLRMRLSAFVLAARLERVVELANERLRHMGEGRYRLRHTDELAGGGRRSGLGLQVEDLWTGQARDPATLSGGESFMASLALALGLADGVREEAGGFDVQTLFVDEGFGTLDEDSLEQVLAVLDDLRDGGRSVGVVSHVAELRSRIPNQLRVTKTSAGSAVLLREGRAGAA